MKETALQQLITSLTEGYSFATHESTKILLNAIIERCKAALPSERQQIEDAYSEGYATAMYEAETIRRTTSTQYFTETYKTD